MPNVQGFSTLRARSYVFRLPLFTRAIALIIIALWLVGLQSVWDLRQWGAMIPDQISFATGSLWSDCCQVTRLELELTWCSILGYRLSTFPLIHVNFLHAILNVLALTPLMERFENEYGTLTTLALFFGRKRTTRSNLFLGQELT